MINRAPAKQYFLNIGAYFLKKGAGYYVGQIVKEKELQPGIYRVSVITGLFYNFQTNQVRHTADKTIYRMTPEELKKHNAKKKR